MAEFRIDQATPGAGVANRSRHDLVAGEVISLVATDPAPAVGVSYTWEIVDAVGSTATLSATTGTTVEIGTAGLVTQPCAFLIRLTANDNGVVTTVARIASVRTSSANLRIPVFGETAPSDASLGSNNPDSSTDNATYTDLSGRGASAQNWRGWAEWGYEVALALESLSAASSPLASLDEGSSLTATTTSVNYTGAGVTAAAVGDDVTVTIPGTPSGSASGDLGGTYPSPTVTRLRGVRINGATPSNGQVITYNSAGPEWTFTTPASGGGSRIEDGDGDTFIDTDTGAADTDQIDIEAASMVYTQQMGASGSALTVQGAPLGAPLVQVQTNDFASGDPLLVLDDSFNGGQGGLRVVDTSPPIPDDIVIIPAGITAGGTSYDFQIGTAADSGRAIAISGGSGPLATGGAPGSPGAEVTVTAGQGGQGGFGAGEAAGDGGNIAITAGAAGLSTDFGPGLAGYVTIAGGAGGAGDALPSAGTAGGNIDLQPGQGGAGTLTQLSGDGGTLFLRGGDPGINGGGGTGAYGDIELATYDDVVVFSDAANASLSATFTATSLVGAVNELRTEVTALSLQSITSQTTAALAPDSGASGTLFDCDTDTAAGDITVTFNDANLTAGDTYNFTKKGTGGDVLFAVGGSAVIRNALTTLSTENGVVTAICISATDILLVGDLA